MTLQVEAAHPNHLTSRFGVFRHCGNGDIEFLNCHMILQGNMITGGTIYLKVRPLCQVLWPQALW